uniref:Hypothetical chloroplast RF15 n=1 Tax=Corydalis trisecta TaxID=2682942 RepID=A0A6B9QIF3_9MAGN|nr:hypothetical chloroplast RF15 [Corydalis trisecta]YP_010318672.1 hypothetical chloroplast RF15 [Corydalis trisecta]QHE65913.1 hypothetical chloroplast RF15 [Corydalis trisecta]QHE65914.1 hypothetical chloroplast RF15 [Corydalis trisecta]ULX45334.1 hypothetical chloroplast RF15 [Corydalis trisecta]ULX45335.1 hypothetical chloroplast RF15 [Corydalis trisecta]
MDGMNCLNKNSGTANNQSLLLRLTTLPPKISINETWKSVEKSKICMSDERVVAICSTNESLVSLNHSKMHGITKENR